MKGSSALLLAVGLATGSAHAANAAFAASPASPARISNHAAPGNLESLNDIGCVSSASLKNSYTPPDLYKGFAKCLAQDDFRKAAFLFMLAGAYGRYDAMRVLDKSAHQAVPVMRAEAVAEISRSRKDAFREEVIAMSKSAAEQAKLCSEARRIGPPNYYPRYMVQHGIDAFLPGTAGGGLKQDFDGRAAWKEVVATYLHCPA